MKIDKIANKYMENTVRKNRDNDKNPVVVDKDKVEISSSAKSLVKKINQSENSMFSEKVEKIRKAVQEGSYKVSPENIADKILKEIETQNDLGEKI